MSYSKEHAQLLGSLNPPAALVRMEKSSYSVCYPTHTVAFTLLIDQECGIYIQKSFE